jgi:DNA-binding IclR family transcriptional regulator
MKQNNSMDAAKLNKSDHKILDVLNDGRCTPAALAEWADLSEQTIHNRLNVLVAAGHVKKAHESGLYEVVEDPRT